VTLEQLEKNLASLPDETVAERAKAALLLEIAAGAQKRQTLRRRIAAIRAAKSELAEVDSQLDKLKKWRDFLVASRQTLCDEVIALRPQDERRYGLALSIMQIDRGLNFHGEGQPQNLRLDDLMKAAGYASPRGTLAETCGDDWLGSMRFVDQQIKELNRRHDVAQERLAEALRDDPV